MERPTPAKGPTFRFAVDHQNKVLDFVVIGKDGAKAEGALDVDRVDQLMATLSQCQHALVLSKAGGEQLAPPFDPARSFEEHGGHILARRDAISRHAVGVDTEGTVNLLLLGSTGRLSGYRMSPERARQIAHELVTAAAQTPIQPKSYDA
jgi:hypothetical protein